MHAKMRKRRISFHSGRTLAKAGGVPLCGQCLCANRWMLRAALLLAAATGLLPPPLPPPLAPGCRCSNECIGAPDYAEDSICDDGGVGSQYSSCELGSDCEDCGFQVRCLVPPLPPPAAPAIVEPPLTPPPTSPPPVLPPQSPPLAPPPVTPPLQPGCRCSNECLGGPQYASDGTLLILTAGTAFSSRSQCHSLTRIPLWQASAMMVALARSIRTASSERTARTAALKSAAWHPSFRRRHHHHARRRQLLRLRPTHR